MRLEVSAGEYGGIWFADADARDLHTSAVFWELTGAVSRCRITSCACRFVVCECPRGLKQIWCRSLRLQAVKHLTIEELIQGLGSYRQAVRLHLKIVVCDVKWIAETFGSVVRRRG